MSVGTVRYHYYNKVTRQTLVRGKEDKSLEKQGFELTDKREVRPRNAKMHTSDNVVTKGMPRSAQQGATDDVAGNAANTASDAKEGEDNKD